MASEPKADSSDSDPSMLANIMDRLKPVLFRRWKKASRAAKRAAKDTGVTDVDAFMAGFQKGYWSGAVDVSTERLKPKDLPPTPELVMTKTKIHH